MPLTVLRHVSVGHPCPCPGFIQLRAGTESDAPTEAEAALSWILHLRPPDGELLLIQQTFMRLLHQQRDAGRNPGHGGLIELAQTSGVALLRRHTGVMGKALDRSCHRSAIELLSGSGDKHRASGNPRAADVSLQLVPQGGGNTDDPPDAVGRDADPVLLQGLRGQLRQFLYRQTNSGEDLYQQIGPLFSRRPGGGEGCADLHGNCRAQV